MSRVVHMHSLPNTFCGIRVVRGLPRTSCSEEVTCQTCRDLICEACKGTGLNLDDPVDKDACSVHHYFLKNKCRVCRGSRMFLP